MLGSSLSLRSYARVGSALSVLDLVTLGSTLSLRSFGRAGSGLSVLDFLHIGSCLSMRSFGRIGSAPLRCSQTADDELMAYL